MTKIILHTLPSGHGVKYPMFFRKGESVCKNIECENLDCKKCNIYKRGLANRIFDFYDVEDLLFG